MFGRFKCLIGKHSYYLQFKSHSGKVEVYRCRHCETRLNVHHELGMFKTKDNSVQEKISRSEVIVESWIKGGN